jgi:hypothetical protein
MLSSPVKYTKLQETLSDNMSIPNMGTQFYWFWYWYGLNNTQEVKSEDLFCDMRSAWRIGGYIFRVTQRVVFSLPKTWHIPIQ